MIAGAALTAGWQTASASGIVGQDEPHVPADKPKPTFMSLKGFSTNDENPAHVNALAPQWMSIEFGPWNWNMNAQYNMKWGLHLLSMMPNADDVALAIKHPSYDGWWLCLNEPDLEGISPQAGADLITRQMQVVLSVDPNAKFCLGMGSQLHTPNTANPWFPTVWNSISADLKKSVKAFHTHYYAQVETSAPDRIFSPDSIVQFIKNNRKWINKNAKDTYRELWISEIGLVTDDNIKNDTRLPLYPLVVQNAMNNNAERWAWYSMSVPDGYATLMIPNSGGALTPLGSVFAGLVPGVYPFNSV